MEEGSITIRLKHFLKAEELSPSVFADTCGIPRPSLSQLLNGRNKKISDVHIRLIHNAYPSLSIMWLLFGEGSMLADGISKPGHEDEVMNFSEFRDDLASDDLKKRPIVQGGYEFLNPEHEKHEVTPLQDVDNSGSYGRKRAEFRESVVPENRVNPRKVVQITVFYDDNSYESFAPVKE